ncbi:MAG: hypothetical protein GWO24_18880 [Akkermansiaceae bacterium]|nr:hypothetical protein [Akkermansiaceae bacterium]
MKRSTVGGTWAGAVVSVAVAVTIAFWEDVTGTRGISFLWIMPAAFVSGVGAGFLGSVVIGAPRNPDRDCP